MLKESTRRSGDGSLFQACGAATANGRSPSDDVVRACTATEPDVADLEACFSGRCGRQRDEVDQIMVSVKRKPFSGGVKYFRFAIFRTRRVHSDAHP